MALFGTKPKTGTPTSTVIQMRQQGLSNDQIIQSLQREGFSSAQIFDAMNQADIRGVVESDQPQENIPQQGQYYQEPQENNFPPPQPEAQIPPPQPMNFNIPPPSPEDNNRDMMNQRPMPQMNSFSGGMSPEEIEEIVEPIIDEKWEELMKNVDKIITWKELTESRIVKIEQMMQDLKERFEELHKGILSKIGDYDKSIKDVGSDIKAMESVFKKVLPTFTENVSELSRITKNIKK